jgi:hypothetical protein
LLGAASWEEDMDVKADYLTTAGRPEPQMP